MKVKEWYSVMKVAGGIHALPPQTLVDGDAYHHGKQAVSYDYEDDDADRPLNLYDGELITQRSLKISGYSTPRSYTFRDADKFPDGMGFQVFSNNDRVTAMLRECEGKAVVLHLMQRAASCFEVLQVDRPYFFERENRMCVEVESVGRRLVEVR